MKNYIRGVDGLRAMAVLAVVLFHASPASLRGGFIGVDIFFVISGFIITKTYFDDLQSRRVSLGTFFLKRVRRLAPIYIVVLLVTTIASYVILTPIHLKHFAESLVAQPAYLQNVVFWHHGDYFEKALSKPLLHTWSLAVEEQFYLAYALLILTVRRSPRLAVFLLVAATVASLGLGYVLSSVSPKTAFYWLPTRVWQMAIGVLAARARVTENGGPWRWALYPGLGLIVWAIVGFDEHARFPGPQSLAACGGTALALISVAADAEGPALIVLTNRGVVQIGKLSYSIYLWHWPIISLAATWADRQLRPAEAAAAVAATIAVSHLGYTYLEKPVRSGTLVRDDKKLLAGAAIGGVLTAAVALAFVATDGATYRYRPEIASLYLAQQQRSPFRCPAVGRLLAPGSEICKVNAVEGKKNVLVLGDSHADVLDEMIGEVAAAEGWGAFLTKRDCKLQDFGSRPDCSQAVLGRIRQEIVAHEIQYVLTMSFVHKKELTDEKALEANAVRLLETVDGVFIMQVVPNDEYFDPADRAARLQNGGQLPRHYRLEDYLDDNRAQIESIGRIASVDPRIRVLDPARYLCAKDGCDFDTKGVPNYFDAHHLSPTGARRVAPMFTELFRSLPR